MQLWSKGPHKEEIVVCMRDLEQAGVSALGLGCKPQLPQRGTEAGAPLVFREHICTIL